jgi:predicted negative regulator of RcsB-dependent stress response
MFLREKISEFKEWFKENQKNIFLTILIILVATLSFGLGYLANREFTHSPIIIEKCADFVSKS